MGWLFYQIVHIIIAYTHIKTACEPARKIITQTTYTNTNTYVVKKPMWMRIY